MFKKTFYGLTSSNLREARSRQGFHSFTRIYVCWSGSGFSRSYGRDRGALLQRFWMPKTDIFEGKLYGFFYLSQNWVFFNLCFIIVKNLFESTNFPNFDHSIFYTGFIYNFIQNSYCCLGQIRDISIANKHRENFDKFFVQKRDFRGRFHTLRGNCNLLHGKFLLVN